MGLPQIWPKVLSPVNQPTSQPRAKTIVNKRFLQTLIFSPQTIVKGRAYRLKMPCDSKNKTKVLPEFLRLKRRSSRDFIGLNKKIFLLCIKLRIDICWSLDVEHILDFADSLIPCWIQNLYIVKWDLKIILTWSSRIQSIVKDLKKLEFLSFIVLLFSAECWHICREIVDGTNSNRLLHVSWNWRNELESILDWRKWYWWLYLKLNRRNRNRVQRLLETPDIVLCVQHKMVLIS